MKKKIEDKYNLSRFKSAQSLFYKDALEEIKRGKKETHWMWFIFPQLKQLGFSDNAKYYDGKRDEKTLSILESE